MIYQYESTPSNGVGPEFQEWVKWCEHHFGPSGNSDRDSTCRWLNWYGIIKFRNAEDYGWFKLRWS